ncbi:YheV family putative metal-binding protein [Halomonas denitrificans]|uniref:YheV family putative zinc ribbon protein n=1 Tax=Halomonas TaxID=2745 RepID=UPI001A8E7E1D|nr:MULTISPECIES: YheV family putative zinc ribbon protein [Halomonas]MED5295953.1 YheV family putative zinc ribbon protein [Pseudomonadota bacterium]MBN8413079.1 YheV family putative metal-binding protein [Halomonas litopenaei]MBY5925377.1 YheV family putative metal-binding protein [Halomonas sp. DP4Y7-2]MBY5929207.1 YheV family putative metal-binding protein [Halomonas sp. DP8Y7-3]MBY5968285.1 YheV family putative metal-binding protein [Halomonas denitrificans]
MTVKKRFIAGVVCPRCAEMDRIRAWEQNGVRYRECVSCDFFEQLPIEDDVLEELATRVNQEHDAPAAEEIQPVRILDPGKRH